MDVLKLFDWDQSREAIKQLEKLLECNICGTVAADPQSLGRCDHFFCSACIGKVENGICPVCKIPSPPCEMKPDRIIAGLVSSARDLKFLLDGGELNGPHMPSWTTELPQYAQEPTLAPLSTLEVEYRKDALYN
ncbi:BRCA1-associated RING domain protein 1 [Penaeus vannamei]|uniref:BRCA1-associated RING domain protein 1 n=1 Tax=Penaeus vannamei TaxID=6689 RepID=A0A3R7NBW1_PENVA|nr:BRCA1-associated RING domain protein 1 [Penaeus vannamei]